MRSIVHRTAFGVILLTMWFVGGGVVSSRAEIAAERESVMTEVENYKESPSRIGMLNSTALTLIKQEPKHEQKSMQVSPAIPAPVWPASCERAITDLDVALIEMLKLKETYLIVIARLGVGERSGQLNRYRLRGIEDYVKRKLPDLKYVMAEGSRVKGLGRVELYVGGQLLRTMPIKKNAKGYCKDQIEF